MRQCMYIFNEAVKAYINLVDTMTKGLVDSYVPDPPKTIEEGHKAKNALSNCKPEAIMQRILPFLRLSAI